MSPERATRLGSARLRARPFCSSALIATFRGFLPPTNWLTRKPNGGREPESTPAATVDPTAEFVIGNCEALTWLPILATVPPPKQVPLKAELAARLPRGFDEPHLQHDLLRLHDLDGVDDIWHELAGDGHHFVSVTASGAVPLSKMWPLTEDTLIPPPVMRAISTLSRETS